ncbi:MAG: divalent cation tolerance protein CutA [Candidatus Marinimicrobia bacterium]|nr:divalent cation tolerance protein CutA [Candidatus Neomarinimicrobiota bacterium]
MFKIVEASIDNHNIALKITDAIIQNKLAACVQIIGNVNSTFIWENVVTTEKEFIIKIKTKDEHISEIKSIIIETTNYELPEIISYSFNIENREYEKWFNENTNP